jgi:hypothetical protein
LSQSYSGFRGSTVSCSYNSRLISLVLATWYSGTSETRLRLGPNNSVCYYNYTIQWNLWNPTTAGTKEIGLLYLHDTVEPLKPDYRWDQRNRSVIIATWYSGTSETGLQLESKKLVCYYIYMIQWNLWTRPLYHVTIITDRFRWSQP